MLKSLEGKKTYLVCVATIVYAVAGVYLGFITPSVAAGYIFASLGAGAFRSALSKVIPSEDIPVIEQKVIPTVITITTPTGTHSFTLPETTPLDTSELPRANDIPVEAPVVPLV